MNLNRHVVLVESAFIVKVSVNSLVYFAFTRHFFCHTEMFSRIFHFIVLLGLSTVDSEAEITGFYSSLVYF